MQKCLKKKKNIKLINDSLLHETGLTKNVKIEYLNTFMNYLEYFDEITIEKMNEYMKILSSIKDISDKIVNDDKLLIFEKILNDPKIQKYVKIYTLFRIYWIKYKVNISSNNLLNIKINSKDKITYDLIKSKLTIDDITHEIHSEINNNIISILLDTDIETLTPTELETAIDTKLKNKYLLNNKRNGQIKLNMLNTNFSNANTKHSK